jgi:hypothetical protein
MKIFSGKLKKRGSLEISINAIVILILAITILGLGLGFIKKQFGALGSQFEEVGAEIKSEIIEKIRTSGELLVFNKVEITAQIGKPDTFYIGIKNTAQAQTCFSTKIECLRALQGSCDLANPGAPMTVGGAAPGETGPIPGNEWFRLFTQVDIGGGDVGVYPVTLQVPGKVNPDTYLMEFSVFKADSDCATGTWPSSLTPYQSKQFYINVR